MLHQFKLILGDVDGYMQFTSLDQPEQKLLTTNLAKITFPDKIYVAEVDVDFKDVTRRAMAELELKKRPKNKKLLIKLSMVLNGSVFDGWAFHEGKLFTFVNPEHDERLRPLIDLSSIETLGVSDLTKSEFIEYENLFKELLRNNLKDEFQRLNIEYNNHENCFYFLPNKDENNRRENWVGKKKATRTVFEKKMNTKDPSKVLCFKHLSFEISFNNIGNEWYCLIVPSWLYTYNLYRKAFYHDKYLSKQKRLEKSMSVRNLTRFVAYFLGHQLKSNNSNFSISDLLQLECDYPDLETDEVLENSDES